MIERNIQKNGLANILLTLVTALGVTFISRQTSSLVDEVAVVILWLGVLVAAFSYFQMRLETNERLEKLELDELAKRARSATLFENTDAEAFPAQRAREQFEKWLVPGFSLLLLAGQVVGAWWLWKKVLNPPVAGTGEPLVLMASLCALGFFVQFLVGKYSVGIAKLEGQRLLRPAGSYLLVGAYLCLAAAAGMVALYFGYARTDLFIARALCAILTLLAVENLITLILEIYRPRTRGQASRLLYESRSIGLMGQPEDLFTTAAHALDYQFGFKVSETWFYQFLQRTIVWIVLAQASVLWLSTCLVFIETDEQALLERFGRPVASREVLDPGLHFTLPWPIDRIHRFQTHRVHQFNVGSVPDKDKDKETTLVWNTSHSKEEFNLPIANNEQDSVATNAAGQKTAPPANLLAVSVPVQYQIRDIKAWARNHANARDLIERLATREVVRYLVSVDLFDIMSVGRQRAAETLRERVQRATDAAELGVRIIFVGLQDIHPPITVAESFQAVVGALQTREASILTAQGSAAMTNALAQAEAQTLRDQAEAFKVRRIAEAGAVAEQFKDQLLAFQSAPNVYPQRLYLQAFAKATSKARKYLNLTTNAQELIQLNLEDKIRADILDVEMPPPKK